MPKRLSRPNSYLPPTISNQNSQFRFIVMYLYMNVLCRYSKVEKILKGSLDSITSPSPSVKIQIMDGKVRLRCKGKTLLGVVNKLLKQKVC